MSGQPQPSLNQQLYNAVAALAAAGDRLRLAAERTALAVEYEKEALAGVIEEQKKFDALVDQVKEDAPPHSRWRGPA